METPKYLPHAPSSSNSNLQGIGLLLHIWVVLPNKVYTWRRGVSPPPFGREWFQPLWRFEDMKDWLKINGNTGRWYDHKQIWSNCILQTLHFVCVWWIFFATCPTKTMQNSTAWTTWSFNLNTNQSYFTKAMNVDILDPNWNGSSPKWQKMIQHPVCCIVSTISNLLKNGYCRMTLKLGISLETHFPTSYWDSSLVGEILDKRGNSLQREVKVLIVMDNHGWMFRITSRDLIHE